MAETLANGTVIPQPTDRIDPTGVAAARALGASVDAGLGARVKTTDPRLSDRRLPLAHGHSVGDVDGLQAQLDAGRTYTDEQLAGVADAYDVAVQQGYTGTRAEWLASLVGPRGPEGPAGGTAVTDPQVQAMLADAGTLTGGWVDDALRRGVSVREHGAAGDGVADDTAAIQAAVGASRSVYLPAGRYRITAPITVPSGTVVDMAPDAVVDAGAGLAAAFSLSGATVGSAIALTSEPALNDRGVPVFTTAAPHGLAVGDMVRVRSQRDALHADAGDDWRLGYGTDGVQGSRFAEYTLVSEVISASEFAGSQPLTFPSYRPDQTQETSAYAGPYSTVQKIAPAENVVIRGGLIVGAPATAIIGTRARNARVEGVRYLCSGEGTFIGWSLSWGCEARGCHVTYPQNDATEIYRRNAYKSVSSQSCGYVGCTSDNASQAFDISYSASGGPSLFCYVEGCGATGAQTNGATSHGGTYANRFVDNRFLGCRSSGIANRGRSSIISGNHVEGRLSAENYGIALTEGWARDCIISGNVVAGFRYGFRVGDSADVNRRFTWVGLTLTGNTFTWCKTAVELHRWISATTNVDCGIAVVNNTINVRNADVDAYGVRVANWLNGVVIRGNRINGGGITKVAVLVAENANRVVIEQNHFNNFVEKGIDILSPTDSSITTKTAVVQGNAFTFIPNAGRVYLGANVQSRDWAFFDGHTAVAKMSLPANATTAQLLNVLSYYGLINIT